MASPNANVAKATTAETSSPAGSPNTKWAKVPTSKMMCRVSLLDGSKKTFQVGDKHTIRDLCNMVASKLGMQDCDQFSIYLVRSVDGRESCLHDEDNPAALLRKAKADGANVSFVFKKNIWMEHDEDEDAALSITFAQVQQIVVKSIYHVDQPLALKLGAYQLQASFGDYDTTLHTAGFLTTRDHSLNYIPEHLLKVCGC